MRVYMLNIFKLDICQYKKKSILTTLKDYRLIPFISHHKHHLKEQHWTDWRAHCLAWLQQIVWLSFTDSSASRKNTGEIRYRSLKRTLWLFVTSNRPFVLISEAAYIQVLTEGWDWLRVEYLALWGQRFGLMVFWSMDNRSAPDTLENTNRQNICKQKKKIHKSRGRWLSIVPKS